MESWQRGWSESDVVHLPVVDVAVVDRPLHVTRQLLRVNPRTARLRRRRRLERVGREGALEPRQPLSKHRRVLVRLVVPLQHLRLECDADLVAVRAKHAVWGRTVQNSYDSSWYRPKYGIYNAKS